MRFLDSSKDLDQKRACEVLDGFGDRPLAWSVGVFGRALAIARGLRAAHSNPEVETTSARISPRYAALFTKISGMPHFGSKKYHKRHA